MADNSGQADIRGIDIDKLAKGFADEENVFKKFCLQTTTSAREIRWFQKTSGFIVGKTTSGMTTEMGVTSHLTKPTTVEQSWTRNTSYVKKFFFSSPILSDEDIKDSDIDVLAGNIRDIVRAVENQVDKRIFSVLTEGLSVVNINSVTTNAAWNAASYTGVNIVEDLMEAKQKIRTAGYNPEGAILLLNSLNHKSLITWLIDGKGSSIPSFASQRIADGVVMEILGLKVVVSENVTADYAVVFVPQRAVTWKSFSPISTAIVDYPLIGKEIRVAEEGEALLTDPKAVTLISNTDA